MFNGDLAALGELKNRKSLIRTNPSEVSENIVPKIN